jgi:hypothetical protein
MHTVRPRPHGLCPSCGRYTYDGQHNYCMGCGWSAVSPVLSVLKFVMLALSVLAVVGWLMS